MYMSTSLSHNQFNIKIVDNLDDLFPWKNQWDTLLSSSMTPSLFLTFDWLTIWWKCHTGTTKELFIILILENDKLIGIVPLMKNNHRLFGWRWQSIEFLSTMSHAYSPTNCSGTLDMIALPGYTEIIVGLLFQYLIQDNYGWQYLRLHPIPHTSATSSILAEKSRDASFIYHRKIVSSGVFIQIETSWDEYSHKKSIISYRNMNRAEKKLNQIGKVDIIEITSPDNVKEWYDVLLSIEQKSWKWSHGIRINEKIFNHFYERIIEQAAINKWLHIWILTLDGAGIAYDLSLKYNKIIFGLKTGYDHQYRSFSPGNILTYHVFKKYFEQQNRYIDLLWGDVAAKTKWSNHIELYDEIFIFNNRIISKGMFHLFHTYRLYDLYRFIQRYSYFYSRRIRSYFESLWN